MDNKNEIIKLMEEMEEYPQDMEQRAKVNNYTKMPFSRLASYGVALEPLIEGIQKIASEPGGSGLYFVDTGGKSMFQMKGTTSFIGSLKTEGGMVGGGQAKLNSIEFNPTMIFVAVAMANMDKKLDSIKDMQKEMIDFLVQKEKSELRGNLAIVQEIYNQYKINFENKQFLSGSYKKILDVKQTSEQKIDFYRNQITKRIEKTESLHRNKGINDKIEYLVDHLNEYQMALYILGFASCLEICLLGNCDEAYLNNIVDKLEKYSYDYLEIYTKCYEKIEEDSFKSIEANVLKSLSSTTKFVGKTVEKIPFINKAIFDEALIAAGEKMEDAHEEMLNNKINILVGNKSNVMKAFIDNINTINELYNKPINLVVDQENLYLATSDKF